MQRANGDDYSLTQKLGVGGFADVHLAVDHRDGNMVALKRFCKRSENKIKNHYHQEIKVANLINHDGIAKTFGFFESSHHYWLVMEFVEGIELIQLMELRKFGPLYEQDARNISVQIVNALLHAHNNGVAHLDLKLDNILIDSKMKTKIIDWGLSVCENPNRCYKLCGSLEYVAPEVFNKVENDPYDAYQADVFSLGTIFFSLLVGKFPFKRLALQSMRKGFAFGGLVLPDKLSEGAKDLLRKMLDTDPKTRITLKGVQNHPWITTVPLVTSNGLNARLVC